MNILAPPGSEEGGNRENIQLLDFCLVIKPQSDYRYHCLFIAEPNLEQKVFARETLSYEMRRFVVLQIYLSYSCLTGSDNRFISSHRGLEKAKILHSRQCTARVRKVRGRVITEITFEKFALLIPVTLSHLVNCLVGR